MQLFYGTKTADNLIILSEDESHHCSRVLRKKEGDEIEVVDGFGNYYVGRIVSLGKAVEVSIIRSEERLPNRSFKIHIAIAPTKNMDRMEWFVEKATEIGVDRISLVLTEHSERNKLRTDRLVKKAISAMKQSGQAVLPEIDEPDAIGNLVPSCREKHRFVAHLSEEMPGEPLLNKEISGDVVLFIGPEGDFSPDELQNLKSHGFEAVTMGFTRLRTETAGVVACTILNQLPLLV